MGMDTPTRSQQGAHCLKLSLTCHEEADIVAHAYKSQHLGAKAVRPSVIVQIGIDSE